jgi:hypothetical protein
MNKTITTFMILVPLLLTGCATLAPSPTATPAPTETSVPILATSADDLIGIWQFGSGNFALFFQFEEDGNYKVAQRVATNLQDSPNQMGQFMVEGGLLTLVTSDESVLCAGDSGTYEVRLQEQGQIDLFLLEDSCSLRAATIYLGLEPLSP